jgi:hypothetical protein
MAISAQLLADVGERMVLKNTNQDWSLTNCLYEISLLAEDRLFSEGSHKINTDLLIEIAAIALKSLETNGY